MEVTMRRRSHGRLPILGLAIASVCTRYAGAAAPTIETSKTPLQTLEEVEIRGTRLWKLRADVIKAEDRLVATYNELNKDDDLDIECLDFTPTGTHVSYRYCRSVLQRRAQEDDSWRLMGYLRGMDAQEGAGGGVATAAPSAQTRDRLLERQDDYLKNLRKLLQDSPELRSLATEHDDARRRYNTALEMRKQRQ